jgi:hypothetical protein
MAEHDDELDVPIAGRIGEAPESPHAIARVLADGLDKIARTIAAGLHEIAQAMRHAARG